MGLLTPGAEEREDLDRIVCAAGHAVRCRRVEFSRFPCAEDGEFRADLHVQRPGEHEHPLVANMGFLANWRVRLASGHDQLERLNPDRPGGQGNVDHPVTTDRPGMHARVTRRRRTDAFVEGHMKDSGDLQQHVETRVAQSRFEPGRDADRDSRAFAEVGEPEAPPRPQLRQPRADAIPYRAEVFVSHAGHPPPTFADTASFFVIPGVIAQSHYMSEFEWDVVVIGGGSAGLSAALMLGRARRRVLVLDAGAPRNRFAAHMHGVLGHDGKPPLELLAVGRAEVEAHGGFVWNTSAVMTRQEDDGFAIETGDSRTVWARTLVVATGASDELPGIGGLAERWGSGVAACPYCDGYEVRDRRIGILATGPESFFQAQLLRQWSDRIIYLPHTTDNPTGENRAAFDARGIHIENGQVTRVLSEGDRLSGVQLDDERTIELDAIFTAPRLIPQDAPLRQLEAERTEHSWGSFATVDASGRTSVDGVWAVGNVVNPMANVPVSIGTAALVAGAVNHALVLEDIRLALSNSAEVEMR